MALLKEIPVDQLEKLSTYSLEKFCEGYSQMFGTSFSCRLTANEKTTPAKVKEACGSLLAVNHVICAGEGEGTFMVVLDKAALFTLGGFTVMQPAPRIRENCQRGTEEDVQQLSDATGEVGNLLVGEMNTFFRDGSPSVPGLGETEHLRLRLPVDSGNVEVAFPDGEAGCNLFTYEMKLGDFDPIQVRVAFPTED